MTPHDDFEMSTLPDPLAPLRDVDRTPPVPSVADVQRRGRAIARGRRVRRLTGTGALAVGLVVGSIALPRLGEDPVSGNHGGFLGVAPAAAGDGAACDASTGFGSWIDRSEWHRHPDVVSALSVVGGLGTPLNAGVHVDTMDCPTLAPVAVLYDADPVRGITVWRDVANPWGDQAELADEQVRGRTGLLAELDGGTHVLSWRDADGVRWLAMADGMAVPLMIGTLDDLTFADGVVDPSSVPRAFESAPAVGLPSTRTTREWEVTYGDGSWNAQHVDLRAARAAQPVEVVASSYSEGVTFTTVRGRTAVVVRDSDDWATISWIRGGVRFIVGADGDLARLRALAARVRTVAPTDPSLAGVPDPRGVQQEGR